MSRRARFKYPVFEELDELRSPADARQRLTLIKRDREHIATSLRLQEKDLAEVRGYLELAPKVEAALQTLSQQVFAQLVGTLEDTLTIALQEVLEQPIRLRALPDYKRGGATVEFFIERDGQREDIMRGQGGSVANILSVGLRMFALARLDDVEHRPFLVLDEPDGWLRPELVPRLVKIIHDAGTKLGFQVLLISHHEVDTFREYADKIYEFQPQPDGSVKVVDVDHRPQVQDGASPKAH